MAKSSTLPYDSAPRVTSPIDDECSMQPNITKLTVLCTSLQRQHSELLAKFQAQDVEILKLKERVKVLEDREGIAATRSGDDAPIKGRSIDEGEAATERISDDIEEMATVLTSMDAATVLAGGIDDVPTGSGSIPTAGPPAADIPIGSDVVPTASSVFSTATVVTPYSRRKGKEVMVESDTPKKKRLQEQIDTQVAKELEEQQEREGKRMTEQIARDTEVARIHAEEELQGMIDGLDRNNETIAKYLQEYQQFATELPLERRIELISDLKLKSSKEVVKEAKSTAEIPEEKIKEMMQLIPIKEVYVEALQVKHPIIDWKDLVKEYLSIRPASSDKEIELWVELKRLYEPDSEDQLWAQTQNFMHAPVKWKLYDLCGVHQVTAKDKEIFMLVEKDYPLRKGLALKLQVENFSHMANDLVLKIYKIANSPRHQGD
nr:hypothetical protein [Tanacetum cinerariifolium]